MEKELIQKISKLKETYENKIEEIRGVPHYEDQDAYDWTVLAYEEIVFDLEELIEERSEKST